MSGQPRSYDPKDPVARADQNTVRYTVGPRGFMGPSGVGVGRPKPLHWTRIRLVATVAGMLIGVVVAILTDTRAVTLSVPLGAIVGLLVVTAMERAGVYRRTDEL